MNLQEICPKKLLTPEQSVKKIQNGSRVFIGTGCGEPQQLIKAMVSNPAIQDIIIYQMLSSTLSAYVNDKNFLSRFSIKLFFISPSCVNSPLRVKSIISRSTSPRSPKFSRTMKSALMLP